MTTPADDRTEAIVRRWTTGDYPSVGALFVPAGEALVAAAGVTGRDVLDAACGTGTVALAAVAAGARSVTGVDLTPSLLDVARQRVAAADATVTLLAGDLLELPLPDAAVDVTLSSFGAFTADDPTRCADELARVTRPGGTVGITAWRADGMLGDHAEVGALVPDETAAAWGAGPKPYEWADPDGLAAIVADTPLTVRSLETRDLVLTFPSVRGALDWFFSVSGPLIEARAAFGRVGVGDADLRAAFETAWSRFATPRGDGAVDLHLAYGLALLDRP